MYCEIDPAYYDYCLPRHRVKDDHDYKNKAFAFERKAAAEIDTYI